MSTPAPALSSVPPPEPVALGNSPALWRALVPKILLDSTPAEWLFKLTARRRQLLLLTVFSALVLFPYLGAVGFWDPWEAEYDEVAREMIWRGDFIHPWYETGSFLSKPVLSFWLMAIGQLLARVNSPERGVGIYTEWCVRSIFALTAVGGVLMTYLAVARTIGQRAAIWAGVILVTSPFYFLIARQTMVDMPFVSCNTAAIACLMIALFEKDKVQDGWLYAFYFLCGVTCLAKGLLGIALPGGAALVYLILSGDWRLLRQLRLITGPLLTLAVMAPWYGVMIAFKGLDYEDQVDFWQRFIIHDHFKRIGYDPQAGQFIAGVHTTTPNTNFTYFIEQLGYGLFPWVAMIPGAAGLLARPSLSKPRTRQERAKLFVFSWIAFTFLFFSISATKFHHYALPLVPPLAILFGLYVVKLLEEGIGNNIATLALGFIIYVLVAQNLVMEPKHLTDMFVYNYDRPYPTKEVDQAVLFHLGHWAVTGQGFFGILFALGPLFAMIGITQFRVPLAEINGTWLTSVKTRLEQQGHAARAWMVSIPAAINRGFAVVMRLIGIREPVREEPRDRLFVVGSIAILAFASAVYISSYHWRKLSPHWSQRDLIWNYIQQSTPDEPLGAYQMNWKGETFYTRNVVRQLKSDGELKDFIAGAGDRKWVVTEQGRVAGLKNVVGAGYEVKIIDKSDVKYALTTVTKTGR